MQFGVCAGPERVGVLEAAGFDYIELGVAGHLKPEAPEAEILGPLAKALAAGKLPAKAFNGFLPGDLKVVGDSIDPERQVRYARSAAHRAAELGGEIIVFGSAGARNVPEGFPRERARQQIVEFLTRIADVMAKERMTIAIEPLNSGESNMINSVAEGAEIAHAVNHPAIKVLSDLYHVDYERQSYAETSAAGESLVHVHVAGKANRQAPISADAAYLVPYFEVIRGMGYGGRISVEGGWKDIEAQARECREALDRAWEMAG